MYSLILYGFTRFTCPLHTHTHFSNTSGSLRQCTGAILNHGKRRLYVASVLTCFFSLKRRAAPIIQCFTWTGGFVSSARSGSNLCPPTLVTERLCSACWQEIIFSVALLHNTVLPFHVTKGISLKRQMLPDIFHSKMENKMGFAIIRCIMGNNDPSYPRGLQWQKKQVLLRHGLK